MNVISHVTFRAKDYDKSMEFYKGILQMNISREFIHPQNGYKFVFLKASNDFEIELIFTGQEHQYSKDLSIGFKVDNYDEVLSKLKEQNYKIEGPVKPMADVEFFHVLDPNNVSIQIMK